MAYLLQEKSWEKKSCVVAILKGEHICFLKSLKLNYAYKNDESTTTEKSHELLLHFFLFYAELCYEFLLVNAMEISITLINELLVKSEVVTKMSKHLIINNK